MSGLAAGMSKGHVVTKLEGVTKTRPAYRKGQPTSKRVKFIRELVREVMGLAPYEKRIIEVLKVGKDKRALRIAKRKLGSHQRGMRKRDELADYMRKK